MCMACSLNNCIYNHLADFIILYSSSGQLFMHDKIPNSMHSLTPSSIGNVSAVKHTLDVSNLALEACSQADIQDRG